jgi:hypothetical protein
VAILAPCRNRQRSSRARHQRGPRNLGHPAMPETHEKAFEWPFYAMAIPRSRSPERTSKTLVAFMVVRYEFPHTQYTNNTHACNNTTFCAHTLTECWPPCNCFCSRSVTHSHYFILAVCLLHSTSHPQPDSCWPAFSRLC